MNAEVIDLDSRRPPSTCGCRAGSVCYPHRLTNMADLLRAELDDIDALLVDRSTLDRLAAGVFAVVDDIAAECLPTDERTAR